MKKNVKLQQHLRYILYMIILGIGLLAEGRAVKAQDTMQLQVKIADYQSVLLQWEADSAEDTFQIQRRLTNQGEYTIVATVSGQTGMIQCYDYNVKMGKSYSYKVVQMSGDVIKRESAVVSVQVKLPAPDGVKGKTMKDSRVKLSWSKVSQAASYTIYRSTKENKGYKKLATVSKNCYTDYDICKGQSYYYRIVANSKKKKAYSSDKSDIVCVHIRPAAPKVVGNYVKKKIKLTWKKVTGADVYYVYKKNAKGKYALVGKTSKLNFTDSHVTQGKTYAYKVVAVKKIGERIIKGKASSPCKVLASTIDSNKKMVALTYDDGPGRYTNDILKCLKDNQGKATFFVLGCNIDAYKSTLKKADKIGCEIGNHTYNHLNLAGLSKDKIIKEINATDAKIQRVIGKKATVMRPPFGSISNTVEDNVGKPIILWSIDTRDWEHHSSSKTIREVMDNVQDGDIILMHDIHESTKTASLSLIPQLRREGYQLVTVSELAKYRSYEIKKGHVYRHFRKKK